MSPDVGSVRSPMIRSRVDLPHPDGPMRDTNSPAAIERSIESSAATDVLPSPNTLPTPRASTTAGVDPAGVGLVSGGVSVMGSSSVAVASRFSKRPGRPVPAAGQGDLDKSHEADEQ